MAAGFYGGGTQFLDVRDPATSSSYGHATWGASEVWDSMLDAGVQRHGRDDRPKKTNLVYSIDLVRGIDVYAVDLPGTTWDTSAASIAPVGNRWLTGGPLAAALVALVVAVALRRRTSNRETVAVA